MTAQVGTRDFAVPVATATGTASAGATTNVVPVSSAEGRTIVTGVSAQAGSVLSPGQMLAEVSGRPLLALALPFDLYRDLAPGDSGPDVRALQQALADAGVSTGSVDGTFGPRTSEALRTLYSRNGVAAPEPSPEKTAALDEALKALAEASKPASPSASTEDKGSSGAITGMDLDDGADSDSGTGPDEDDAAAAAEAKAAADAEAAAAKAAADVEAAAAAEARRAKAAELAELQVVVDQARLAADTPLPMAEIITVPTGGVDVLSVAAVGTSVAGESASVATLRQGSLSVTARVGVKDTSTFPVGSAVTVTLSTGGTGVEGTVAAVSDFRGADDTSVLPGFDITVTFPPDTVGLDDAATVVVRPSGAGEARSGLGVPLVALRNEGAQPYVFVVTGGTTRRVDVTPDLTADGFALVTSDELNDGDTVLISGTP